MTEPSATQPLRPSCYRHPDRETYVRCVRCDRPICPDCMVEAPVGFQCVECVREGNRDLKQGRTISGGVIHKDPTLITKILVAINVIMFGLQYLTQDAVTRRFWMTGAEVAFYGDWWRLMTSAFLHAGVTHLLFNMVALWVVGDVVEPRLGRWRFLTVYLVSAFAGSVLSYVVDPINQPSVGASGAVFGLFGALFVLALRLRFDIRGIIALIVINIVIGFIPGWNINWRAHIGGLIAGAVVTAAMVYAPQRQRLAWSIGASVAVVALCIAAVVVRTNQLQTCVMENRPADCNTGIWGPSASSGVAPRSDVSRT